MAPTRRDAALWAALTMAWIGARAQGVGGGGAGIPAADGYGMDPDLAHPPPRPWPEAYDEPRRRLIARLADTVLPAAADRPAPSDLGVPAFMAAWLGAPYPEQMADHRLLTPLIDQLHAEDWIGRKPPVRHARLNALAETPAFRRFVALTAGAYYTTTQGARLVGFVGNAPSARFPGPPPDVIARLDAAIATLPARSGPAVA